MARRPTRNATPADSETTPALASRIVPDGRLPTALAKQHAVVAALGVEALRDSDLRTLLDSAVTRVADTLGIELTKVLELQPDGERLLLRAGVGWRRGHVGRTTVEADHGSQAGFTLVSDAPWS